jgi:hypothetical protein
MKQASLKVIGVYRPVISAETWHEQVQVTGDEQAAREHFEKLVLIEAVVEGLTGRFDFSKFGQVLSGYRNYPDNMQVGYDEGLLSADGECLIQRRMHCVQGTGPLRFAVYLDDRSQILKSRYSLRSRPAVHPKARSIPISQATARGNAFQLD